MPNVSLSTRALVVALKAPLGGAQTSAQVSVATGIPVRTVNKIYMRARKRGFMPYARPLALADEFLADAPRSGRPPTRKKDEEVEGGRKKRKKMGRPKKVVSKKAPVTAAVPVDASNQGQADAAMPDYGLLILRGLIKVVRGLTKVVCALLMLRGPPVMKGLRGQLILRGLKKGNRGQLMPVRALWGLLLLRGLLLLPGLHIHWDLHMLRGLLMLQGLFMSQELSLFRRLFPTFIFNLNFNCIFIFNF
ncbi:hypothetical protein ESCO_006689 [Escovopsis weberi]|uniref:Uncharacterized protein n=1 Tax=Escovopsis weberi TaxID=150374 RepID=A0A0M8N1Y1_ESCWE|nr:hypothetical protein ESCO_006689 [Escovopsis weberi]